MDNDLAFRITKDLDFSLLWSKSITPFFLFWPLAGHVGSQLSDQGSNAQPLHWEHRVLTTGLPEKSNLVCMRISLEMLQCGFLGDSP